MKNSARQRWIIALGGAMYSLFAAFGFQAERLGESRPLQALGIAALLFIPA